MTTLGKDGIVGLVDKGIAAGLAFGNRSVGLVPGGKERSTGFSGADALEAFDGKGRIVGLAGGGGLTGLAGEKRWAGLVPVGKDRSTGVHCCCLMVLM